MQDVPFQNMSRFYAIAEEDPEYQAMRAKYEAFKTKFERFAYRMPKKIRNDLFGYPGMGYLMSQRRLQIACKYMVFQDEVDP